MTKGQSVGACVRCVQVMGNFEWSCLVSLLPLKQPLEVLAPLVPTFLKQFLRANNLAIFIIIDVFVVVNIIITIDHLKHSLSANKLLLMSMLSFLCWAVVVVVEFVDEFVTSRSSKSAPARSTSCKAPPIPWEMHS